VFHQPDDVFIVYELKNVALKPYSKLK